MERACAIELGADEKVGVRWTGVGSGDAVRALSVADGSPAAAAGIAVGDLLLAVDGLKTAGATKADVSDAFRRLAARKQGVLAVVSKGEADDVSEADAAKAPRFPAADAVREKSGGLLAAVRDAIDDGGAETGTPQNTSFASAWSRDRVPSMYSFDASSFTGRPCLHDSVTSCPGEFESLRTSSTQDLCMRPGRRGRKKAALPSLLSDAGSESNNLSLSFTNCSFDDRKEKKAKLRSACEAYLDAKDEDTSAASITAPASGPPCLCDIPMSTLVRSDQSTGSFESFTHDDSPLAFTGAASDDVLCSTVPCVGSGLYRPLKLLKSCMHTPAAGRVEPAPTRQSRLKRASWAPGVKFEASTGKVA
eukprot:TRINITY_DN2296_c1_g1_i1.p1 TRINITY_DN2296_c1_g1~~TRINITY_DN2296_c1_g1_i1.p1  ORF type:complete len:363 (+),score=129.51 TRINITY_DN2296_c1_g1_i1:39-1127(+)